MPPTDPAKPARTTAVAAAEAPPDPADAVEDAKPAKTVEVRGASRDPVVAGSGRTYARGDVGEEDPRDPTTRHLLDAGLLVRTPQE